MTAAQGLRSFTTSFDVEKPSSDYMYAVISDQPWISTGCNPCGYPYIGTSTITVSANTSGLSVGTHTGTATVYKALFDFSTFETTLIGVAYAGPVTLIVADNMDLSKSSTSATLPQGDTKTEIFTITNPGPGEGTDLNGTKLSHFSTKNIGKYWV